MPRPFYYQTGNDEAEQNALRKKVRIEPELQETRA
jgi:hypothetical protein